MPPIRSSLAAVNTFMKAALYCLTAHEEKPQPLLR
jgi:hypothetical protein